MWTFKLNCDFYFNLVLFDKLYNFHLIFFSEKLLLLFFHLNLNRFFYSLNFIARLQNCLFIFEFLKFIGHYGTFFSYIDRSLYLLYFFLFIYLYFILLYFSYWGSLYFSINFGAIFWFIFPIIFSLFRIPIKIWHFSRIFNFFLLIYPLSIHSFSLVYFISLKNLYLYFFHLILFYFNFYNY